MVENENIDSTNSNEQGTGGRRRRGIFGSRRVSRPAGTAETPVFAGEREIAEQEVVAEQADTSVAEATADAGTPDAATDVTVAVTEETAAAESVVDVATIAADGHEPPALPERHGDEQEAAGAVIPGLPPTTLLFQAPDIVPLPPLPDEEPTGTMRRRSRRRAGENGRTEANDPANTVVKVRTPREPELITEPQKVKGSTRLEAKKQRRRDGRDAGRRRPVITEAEFLARRESVDRQMVVRSKGGRIQIGVLEDKVLVEHYVARSQEASLIGNVYLGRVQNVLPSMEAAFVDIGRGRNAVLYSGEVDWDAVETGNQPRRIELALKAGDRVLVQVTKDPVGHKGARLTSQISLPGRYLVYVPNGSMNGISRKLPDTERSRLKKILKEVLPESAGVIVRTAAEGATEEQLTLDVTRLTAQWADISRQVETQQAPALLHSEPDLLIKIIRDVFNEDFQKLIIAGDDARQTIESYLRQVAPDLIDRVEAYTGDRDAFDEHRITEQIEKALERKVWLPSGGSLVIDRTEAMTVVDVNTGKFVGSGGNLEETVTKNNLEAAEEIVRQLRLRDIGGIIVVDFIDMVLESNRDLVLRRLIECLSRDRTKHQVAEVTSLGLVQMTRKKLGLGLLETFSEACEVCAGRGVIVHHDPVVKHRQPQQQPQSERRRGRGGNAGNGNGNGGGQQQQASAAHTNGTHALTDDAKNALAQIAASTIHPHHEGEVAPAAEPATQPAQVADAPAADAAPKKRRRKGKGPRDEQRQAEAPAAEAPAAETKPEPAAQESAPAAPAADEHPHLDFPMIDLPEPSAPVAHAPVATAVETELLLDSVLDALPQPKAPGQGRSRGRRASTAVITGGQIAGEKHED
ncbi:Rne/Rng family ribonuclease [Leifsonia shinshuensis]|uniref:Ribonuclease E n=1 Tax=Leifsonia shinshuensis TaxID=150026 RepID=A0A7G6Y7B4_9MICO|nr:Rne/Rng family ribonuclease [Leifsonia shinshuensis]QNE34379.1 Rne/Rng family ribonuclease [Leifsonia shinshuensis]